MSAPAGFGKTTLLAQWLHEPAATDRVVAWVSLDDADNDSASFWRYVIAALQTVEPRLGAKELVALQAASPPPIHRVLITLLNDLGALEGDVVLVLDDYHVISTVEVHEALAYLLDHAPPNLHLVVASRVDPPLPLARLRARAELVEVRADHLRFSTGEVATYLGSSAGLSLSDAELAALEDRTEGWIAALQLAALSLQDHADTAGFIAAFAGDDRYIVDYLVEEVLRRQPDDIVTFLLQTSILGRMSGDLCDAVTGVGGGRATLEELDRRNLFVVPLDDHRQWYRYHHLFADVLHARLLDERPQEVRAAAPARQHLVRRARSTGGSGHPCDRGT